MLTDGADLYERDSALDRVRWASSAVLEPRADVRLAMLASGEADDSTVVLQDSDLATGEGTGTAEVELTRDDPGHLSVTVDAQEDGWLVVADSWAGGGWSATVDGQPARTAVGDHALGVVQVPAGSHEVELVYRAPGLRLGVVASVATVAFLVLVLAVPPVVRRVRRRGDVTA